MKARAGRRDKIIEYLRDRDGVITSDDGRGLTAAIAAEVGYDDYLTAEMAPYPLFPDQMARDTATHLDRIICGK